MRFSEAWLREYVNPDINNDQLVQQLTMAGLEVDSTEPAAGQFSRVVVGKVVQLQPHPNADRLRVCRVDIGDEDPLQIVCGAGNVYEGMLAPTALVNAELPGEFKIKKSKLRGEASHGMLCSEKELGLADAADGLMELPCDAPIGQDIREFLQLDDIVIEVDLTPNRADCLSIEGIAREVAVLNRIDMDTNSCKPSAYNEEVLPIEVDASEACPRYLGRIIRGVNPLAATPLWMQERLRRSGLRSLGPLVDVTNFVMLELGQPLHAFDNAKIEGGIKVRYAAEGECLALLNGEEIKLLTDSLVICDSKQPLALAGIMGGQESAVSDSTTDIFLECAFFAPAVMMGKARNFGLHTDSSHRFERGVDPQLQERAIERASQLIIDIAGGTSGKVNEVSAEQHLPPVQSIVLRIDRIKRILGIDPDPAEIEDILSRLGMLLEPHSSGWRVTPPSYRFDVVIEADLIEEIGRIVGYDNLPRNQLLMHAELSEDSEKRMDLERLKDLLAARGYQEAITYSFVDDEIQKRIEPEKQSIRLANPISSELAVMRSGLWCGLLLAAQNNLNRQQSRIRIFETGLRFERSNDSIEQNKSIAGLILGADLDEQWTQKSRSVDFYDIKSDVEAILDLTSDRYQFVSAAHPALHPGQSAKIVSSNGTDCGWLGMLHPQLEKSLGFDTRVFLFDLLQEQILRKSIPVFSELSRYPSVRRDLAIIIKENIAASDIVDLIYRTNGALITDIKIFDVYRGQGVESGARSVALGLIFQDSSATLQDSKIDAIVSDILKELECNFDAKLRE